LFLKFANRLSLICGAVAVALLAAAIVIVCQMVFIRYILNGSTAWQTDVVIFCLTAATLLGSSYVLRERGHVTVDLLVISVGAGARRIMLMLADFVVFVFAAVLFWKGAEVTWQAWEGNWLTETVAEIPFWIPYLAMPIGFAALGLQAIAGMIGIYFGLEDERQRAH
jgi:TRAP-type C4-dicarboxylate transport system permease small subunit